ncbi:MAG: transposase [Phycisphaerae bacterium]|nr:transposase [Phycisphaerae bacterium]
MKKLYANVAFGGMDVHYKFTSVTFRDMNGLVVAREKLDHRDREKLKRRLSQWPPGLPVVMEASFGWAWLSNLMIEAGLKPLLSNCFKVEKMRKARGWAKTNKKDADLLSLLPFEATDWWRVWLAPPDVRDCREQMRYRGGLVELQTGTKCRIHAVFHRHGIFHDFSDLFGSKGRQFLIELCRDGGDGLLFGGALDALRGQVMLLDQIRKQLADVARKLRKELEGSPLAKLLDGVPGFGLILAHVLMAEIGKIERFRHHRALASYSLLAPMSVDTGEPKSGRSPLGRHLGHRGNRTLKWAFIEAAHGAVRSGGRWRAMFDRYTDGGKKNRGRGYIKVARELVKVVYVVWSKNMPYTENPPRRPGSLKGRRGSTELVEVRRASRSGTGQPCHPMVVA